MAFKMNKPVIHGSKEHSALLATAEATRTHGADPGIMAAVADYGKSNSPDIIDWQIKMAEIELAEKEEKEVEVEKEEEVETTEVPIVDMQQLTVNERKTEIAKVDEEAAIKRLEDAAKKRKKDTPGQYYEEGTQTSEFNVGLPKPKNLIKPANVTQEDIDLNRVIMTEDGYREAKWWTKQRKTVTKVTEKRRSEEKKKTEKKKTEEKKTEEKKTTTKKRNTLEDLKYKLAGSSGRAKMIEEGYVPK